MRKTNNKTTGKAKRLIMAVALFILSVSQAWAYDFSVVVPSGQTLYFTIRTNTSSNEVTVVWPNASATTISEIYTGYTEPTGNLVIPSTVTYNGTTYTVTGMGTAFANCEGLTSVTIPNTVTYIALNAFRNCTGLTSVTIPNSVTSIGKSVFYDCSNLTSVTLPNLITTIDSFTFYNCTSLTSITIPNSVTSINKSAFCYCSSLTSVSIPNSVTSIEDYAFYECSGLTSFTIPNSVTSIGDWAFYNCTGLTSVTIPNSVTSIGEDAFYNVRRIIYNGTATGSPWGAWLHNGFIEDGFVFRDSAKTELFEYIGTDTNVTIPNSVTSIGSSAFSGCTGLTSITIPSSVTSIGNAAFANCASLTTLNFNAINCNYCNDIYYLSDLPFYDCPISTINIGDSVQRIPAYFAYNLDSLTPVTIGNSVTTIGDYAFCGCTGLTSITIPSSVTSIGNAAFANCASLTTLNFNAINCSDFTYSIFYSAYLPFNNCSISTINIGDSVQRIPGYFAYGLGFVTSITIPNSVTSIGSNAFRECVGLTSFTIPNSVTSIGSNAFRDCVGLTSFTIPNSVTSIGIAAFYGTAYYNDVSNWNNNVLYKDNCLLKALNGFSTSYSIQNNTRLIADYAFYSTVLTSVTIPSSVTSIGDAAFANCYDLTSITIPSSVTSIGAGTFYNCVGLTSVTIPNSVASIGDSAFYNCRGLTSVTIGNNVICIGTGSFGNCSSIGRIDLKSVTPPSISSNSFQGVSSAISVYIPCGSLSNYSNSNWGSIFPNLQESQMFSLGVAVNDSAMGMALILSNTCANTAIQAYPYEGYNFVGWSDGNTMNPRLVTLTRDTVFTAIFESNIQSHTITVMSANNSMGTVSGGGTYEHGTIIMLTATPSPGYNFVSWNDGNTDNPRTITVTEDATYIASFAEGDAQTYTITAMSANNSMGTVSGGGTYPEGTLVTLTATPIGNYVFVGWNDGNTDNPRTITVTEDATYIGSFAEEDAQTYTITVLSANNSMGTVTGSGTYPEGTVVTIAAIPTEGYRFVSWNDGNTDNPRTITVTEDATYIATFEEGVGIESRDMLSELAFYPNPTRGIITFNRNDIMKVEVLDAMGRMVAVYENAYTIDISKLAKGYYAMRITTPEGVAVRKVIRK